MDMLEQYALGALTTFSRRDRDLSSTTSSLSSRRRLACCRYHSRLGLDRILRSASTARAPSRQRRAPPSH